METSVLRTLCLTVNSESSELKDRITENLIDDDFYFPITKSIFGAISDLTKNGVNVDPNSLEHALSRRSIDVPDDFFLEDLFRGEAPPPQTLMEWIGSLKSLKRPADGSGTAERLTTPGNAVFPTSFSPNGETLTYTELHPETGLDVWTLSIDSGEARPLLGTGFTEAGAMFSPDGNYLTFTSNESGREEVYVRAYPGTEGRWQVSTDSGNEPMWSRDGKELFYRAGTSLMVVDVTTEPSFEAAKPRVLFEAPYDQAGALYANYDVSSDGRNFVMIRSEQHAAASRIHVRAPLARRARPSRTDTVKSPKLP